MLKGIIIGIGKIIPGVSGSMLAISLGLYQKLIDSITNFFQDIDENLKFLTKVLFGVLISVLLFSKLIIKSLELSYIITVFLFIGLIIGGITDIKKEVDKRNSFLTVIVFLLIIILGLINIDNKVQLKSSFMNFVFYAFSGFLDAVTMVVPGISGTATLMMIGAYENVINSISNLTNINLISNNISILFPFSLGMIVGVIITAKLIDYMFKHHKSKTYSAILGFSLSTIVLMAIKCFNTSYTLFELIFAFILMIFGILIMNKFKTIK